MKKDHGNHSNKIAEYYFQLGGLHLPMSVVGNIGSNMKDFGLEKMEPSVYGPWKQMAKKRKIARRVHASNLSKITLMIQLQ